MLKTEFDFYTRLLEQKEVQKNTISKRILKSDNFQMLKDANIIMDEKKGRGYIYRIIKEDKFNDFYLFTYPNADLEVKTEIDNQLKYRDTKATTIKKERVMIVRGFREVLINDKIVDLKYYTKSFSLFSAVLQSLKCQKVCFVENLQTFLEVEKLLGEEYIYIHFYGRLPKEEVLKKIECNEYLHFPDYDFVGLHEYLRAKEVYINAKLFVPENYDFLVESYSKKRKSKDTQYMNVKESTEEIVVKIREDIKTKNRFLEQQVVLELS